MTEEGLGQRARKRRRRPSEEDRLISASRCLLGLGLFRSSSTSWRDSRGPIAFSNDGLIAYRVPYTQPPRHIPSSSSSYAAPPSALNISVKPLIATWRAKPLLLSVPVLPVPDGSYAIRFLSFSSSGSSLLAVVEPEEDALLAGGAAAAQGVVCIWSRSADAVALNHGWALAAAWPLSTIDLGPFGHSILTARWLPSSLKGTSSAELIVTSAPRGGVNEMQSGATAQLPGMGNDAKGKSRKAREFKVKQDVARGPVLVSKGIRAPEGLLLIGADGRAHVVHRNCGVHMNINSSPECFQIASVSLFLPSIGSLKLGHAPPYTRGTSLSHVAIHAVKEEPVLLVATVSNNAKDSSVRLCEVTITNEGDDAMIVSRPLEVVTTFQPLENEASAANDSAGHRHIGSIAFSRSSYEDKESIHLIVASSEVSGTTDEVSISTDLTSISVERRNDVSGRGALCDAFSVLESRKKQVKDLPEEHDWATRLLAKRVVQGERGIVSLVTSGRDEEGHFRAIWRELHKSKGNVHRSASLFDAITLKEEPLEDRVTQSLLEVECSSLSASEAVVAYFGPSNVILRPVGCCDGVQANAIERLVVGIGSAILNRRTYHDLLLANVRLLKISQDRLKVLEDLAAGLEWQKVSTTGQKATLPNINVLTKLLGVHKTICAVTQAHQRHEIDPQLMRENLEADWILDVIRAFRLLQCCRDPGSQPIKYDLASLLNVFPVLKYLNEQCEALARDAFLTQSVRPPSPMEPVENYESKGASPSDISILDLLTRPLPRNIFLAALRASSSLIEWIKTSASDKNLLRDLTASEAHRLASEVRIASLTRIASSLNPEAAAEIERVRVKADMLNAMAENKAMAISARLEMARLGIEGMANKSAVYVDLLQDRLCTWTDPADSNEAGRGQGWSWPIETTEEKAAQDSKTQSQATLSLARHLISNDPGSSGDPKSTLAARSPLKNGGLPLFLCEDDFVDSLADLSGSEGPVQCGSEGKVVVRDAISFAPLPISVLAAGGSGYEVRRDLLSLAGIGSATSIVGVAGRRSVFTQRSSSALYRSSGISGTNQVLPPPADVLSSNSAALNLQSLLANGGSGAGDHHHRPMIPVGRGTSAAAAAGVAGTAMGIDGVVSGVPSGTGIDALPAIIGTLSTPAPAPAPATTTTTLPSSNLASPQPQQAPTSSQSHPATQEETTDLISQALSHPGKLGRMLHLLSSSSSSSPTATGSRFAQGQESSSWWME